MPTFDTPQPIRAEIDTASGHVLVTASERADTFVEVTPSDPGKKDDVQAAAETRVEYASGRLLVKGPKPTLRKLWGRHPSVDVRIDLPAGSQLSVEGWGDFRCEGPLGDVRFSVGAGPIRIERAARLKLRTGAGDVEVGRADGNAEVTTGAGRIFLESVGGTAELKSSSGDVTVGDVSGELRMRTAMGDLVVDRALASVHAKTAYGNMRVREVVAGRVELETAFGSVELGIREGTAAWLDVNSAQGTVRTDLENSSAPDPSEETVEVHARTSFGDILIRRA